MGQFVIESRDLKPLFMLEPGLYTVPTLPTDPRCDVASQVPTPRYRLSFNPLRATLTSKRRCNSACYRYE